MKHRKTVMLLALVLVSAVASVALQVQAYGQPAKAQAVDTVTGKSFNNRALETPGNGAILLHVTSALEAAEELSLDEIDGVDIDDIVSEYESLPDEEKKPIPGVWIVWARGLSWEQDDLPEMTNEVPEGEPVGLMMAVKAIWGTPDWTLYKVARGVVGHDGVRHPVEGYALYNKNTQRFHLSLKGDGVTEFEAVGKVYGNNPTADSVRNRGYLRLVMKGRMTVEGDDHVFAMRGFAHRMWIRRFRQRGAPETVKSTKEA